MATTENEVPAPVTEEQVEKPQDENSTAPPPTENDTSAAVEESKSTPATADTESAPAEDKAEEKTEEKVNKEEEKEEADKADKENKEDGKVEKTEEPPAPEPHVVEAEELFKKLSSAENCQSLLHKHLTQAVFDKIKEKKTGLGGTLADCIRSGESIHFFKLAFGILNVCVSCLFMELLRSNNLVSV